MPTVLVVDDSKVEQHRTASLLAKRPGLTVVCADNGREALAALAAGSRPPDLLLTDMVMPEMGGLELVEAVRRQYPAVPVIVMTAHGSEDVAAEALRLGATSYVPKKHLARDLLETVDRVLGAATAPGAIKLAGTVGSQAPPPGAAGAAAVDSAAPALQYLQSTACRFVVEGNPPHLDPVVRYVEREVARMGLFDEAGVLRLGIALSEALANAVNHGNLGVGSELRETDLAGYCRLLDERRASSPYRERKVYVSADVTRSQAVLVVRDEGGGFDPRSLPDPTAPPQLEKTSGRGMLLIRTFMDEVSHNDAGNEITMVKRKPSSR